MNRPTYITDTSPEAYAVQLDLLRRMAPERRLQTTFAWSRQLKRMALDAIRRRHPGFDVQQVRLKFVEQTYGKQLAEELKSFTSTRSEYLNAADELVAALAPVVTALRHLGVRHYVGGSVASSFHGATRSTMDVDLICELNDQDVSEFIALVGSDFYASEPAIRDAVRRKSCFNLIHLPTSFKVDVFVSRGRPFDIESMQRATTQKLGEVPSVEVPIATAEDSIISKLEWYRLTNESSERQWEDVRRLLHLLGEQADYDYLRRAARSVGVDDLLGRLLSQG